MSTPRIRAIVFDAGHTLLEMDYARVTEYLRARGHEVAEAAVVTAERGARMRLDVEQAARATRARTGQGRYVRFLLDALSIGDDEERRALAEWRRGFNVPIGLCRRADPEAAHALQRAREAGLVVGVISNSNGSVQRALEEAGLALQLDFALGLEAAKARAEECVYVGDSYFVDVVGARRAGWNAVLFDPGRVWPERECPVAEDLCAAVDLALG